MFIESSTNIPIINLDQVQLISKGTSDIGDHMIKFYINRGTRLDNDDSVFLIWEFNTFAKREKVYANITTGLANNLGYALC